MTDRALSDPKTPQESLPSWGLELMFTMLDCCLTSTVSITTFY